MEDEDVETRDMVVVVVGVVAVTVIVDAVIASNPVLVVLIVLLLCLFLCGRFPNPLSRKRGLGLRGVTITKVLGLVSLHVTSLKPVFLTI